MSLVSAWGTAAAPAALGEGFAVFVMKYKNVNFVLIEVSGLRSCES